MIRCARLSVQIALPLRLTRTPYSLYPRRRPLAWKLGLDGVYRRRLQLFWKCPRLVAATRRSSRSDQAGLGRIGAMMSLAVDGVGLSQIRITERSAA